MITSLKEYTLQDLASNSSAQICPERGAIVTSFQSNGRELLYLDRETLFDPTKNVRGGIPILFPTPGKLEDDRWSWQNARGSLKQHGFARNLAWQIIKEPNTETPNSIVLALEDSEQTKQQYPWSFQFELTISVAQGKLKFEMLVSNRGSDVMPFGVGFHPYFLIGDLKKKYSKIQTKASKAFCNVTKKLIQLDPIDLSAKEIDLHLIDHGQTSANFVLPESEGTISLNASEEFTHWVIWSLQDRDFVCLEPWVCPGNALNTSDRILLLKPNNSKRMWLEIFFLKLP